MRDTEFVQGEYYHVFNRGVDKRPIFLTDAHYERFLQSMYLFNDLAYKHNSDPLQKIGLLASAEVDINFRERLVEIVAYCLIPNHYHFLLRQLQEDGISRLMHKLDQGYSRFFNIKHERTGTLYEGPFKAIRVQSEAHLRHLPLYIHLNAFDVVGIPWRDGIAYRWQEAQAFLDGYRWSSHGAYLGRDEYLPLVSSNVVRDLYSDSNDYLTHLKGWSGRELAEYPLELVEFRNLVTE